MLSEFLFKILLLGDSGVGKSSIILRYVENCFSQNLMNSIGVDFKLKSINVEGKMIKLQIWDTAGQERFRTITTSYYNGAQGIVIVYDITDNESFDHVKNWMADIDKFAKDGVLRILVGNKCDLNQKRQVPIEKGQDLAATYGIKFMETSAKDTFNIEELFVDTTKTYLERQMKAVASSNTKGKRYSNNGININSYPLSDKKKKKKKCC